MDLRFHLGVIIENNRWAAMLQQVRISSDRLDHAAIGCKITFE